MFNEYYEGMSLKEFKKLPIPDYAIEEGWVMKNGWLIDKEGTTPLCEHNLIRGFYDIHNNWGDN